ncbi:DUF4350 domain-containing protein [Lacipirellula parvula]|uniref:DUF4350 domain-containing protein n=1 Tax=Lacipirellula parvula TaxID=2650471 RepID=A0A5K7XK92_9BACT|nr:DUF4350 domain-containing protein [Lacipirellula parvula]BBO34683.1 hypothetical protein PLANPX_4295 [Lacipirellula parvula]
MLSARNVIVGVILLLLLSLGSAIWMAFTNVPGQDGWGADSRGVRAGGFRAAHDVLLSLGVAVDRQLIPSMTDAEHDSTFVIWAPMTTLVDMEPAHLTQLSRWVEQGGRLAVTRPAADRGLFAKARASANKNPKDVLTELGLPDVFFLETNVLPQGEVTDLVDEAAGRPWRQIGKNWLQEKSTKVRYVQVKLHGSCREWDGVNAICVPEKEAWSISYDEPQPVGRVTFVDKDDERRTLAAIFPVGKGEIAVMASPAIASNWLLGEADNSVLAFQLMTLGRSRVVFDEFYHGLTIRGNALWLFTQPGYAALALAILAVAGCWIWRSAVHLGPPIADRPVSRRSIAEYVEAMSRFMLRGRGSDRHLLSKLRSGTLWSLAESSGLPPDLDDVDRIAAAIARRDGKRSADFTRAIDQADRVLADAKANPAAILDAIRKVNACLSN